MNQFYDIIRQSENYLIFLSLNSFDKSKAKNIISEININNDIYHFK